MTNIWRRSTQLDMQIGEYLKRVGGRALKSDGDGVPIHSIAMERILLATSMVKQL